MDLYSTSTATAAAGERTSKLFQIHAKLVDIHAMLVDLKANASHLPELKVSE